MTSVKRPRPAFSCRTCRTRKVRCGREQPECANCRRMNRKCEYQSTSKGFEKQRDSQARSCIGHSAVSKLDAVSRGHYRVRQIDDSLFGLTPFPEAGAVDPLPPHIDFLTIASVLKTIPGKHRCDGFVQAFLNSVYPLHPLINLPRFQSWYVDFWRWCGEAGTGDSNSAIIPRILLQDVTMICVLFAVLYSGAASSALTSQESTIVKVSTIAASLIVDPFMSRDLGSLEHGLWVSTVVRLAQSVGLNRRKKDTTDQDEDAETQLRRRVWMHLLWLDVQQRLVTGLPLATTVTAGSSLGSLPKPIAGAGQVDTLARNAAILFHALTETAAIQHRFLAIIENVSASTGVISQEVYQGRRRRRSLGSRPDGVILPACGNPYPHPLFTSSTTANTFIRPRSRDRSRPKSIMDLYNPPLHPISPDLHINYIIPGICTIPLVLRALCGADSVHYVADIIPAALAWLYRCIF
ncbi:hypothetical protein BDW75DRAFT_227162 [Aspergillus navahoensis]